MPPVTHRGDRPSITTIAVVDAEVVVRGIEAMLAPFDDIVVVALQPATPVDLLLVDAELLEGSQPPGPTWPVAAEALARGYVGLLVALTWLPPERRGTPAPAVCKRLTAASLHRRVVELATGRPGATGSDPGSAVALGDIVDVPRVPRRELEVLEMIARGATTDEIARELDLSTNTVKTYTRRLFRRIGVDNRTRAALVAHRMGLVDLSAGDARCG